jgi:hypothetical protein
LKTTKAKHASHQRHKAIRGMVEAGSAEVMVVDEDVTALVKTLLKLKESGVEPVILRLGKKAVDLVSEGRDRSHA